MSERGRVVLIFGVIGAVALGGGYYYFGIYRPKQVKQAAQDEVAMWEQRWLAARACLLGKTPGSPRTSEALAIHELSPDPWNKSTCTPLMAHLNRGDAPDTGLVAVEAAWRELDHAASKAAQAFAEHAAQASAPSTAPLAIAKDPLPGALDALDAARLALRMSVGLADDAATAVPPLPVAAVVPLAAGNDPVVRAIDLQVSAHGAHGFGHAKSGADVQLDLPFGGPPKVSHVAAGELRALPDPSWGARATGGVLAIGAIDASGEIASPIANDAKDVVAIVAALGTPADGTVLYSAGGALGVAHVKNGAVTLEPTVPLASGDSATDLDGRALAWWTTAQGKTYARTFGFGGMQAVPIVTADATANITGCLSADRGWLLSGMELSAVGAGSGVPVPILAADENLRLDACMPDGAVVESWAAGDDPNTKLCTDACRPLSSPRSAPDAVRGVVGGQVVGAVMRGSLLAVWRGANQSATYYAVPGEEGATATQVYGDGKALNIVLQSDGVAIARVPL